MTATFLDKAILSGRGALGNVRRRNLHYDWRAGYIEVCRKYRHTNLPPWIGGLLAVPLATCIYQDPKVSNLTTVAL
jgi:hypothetical protein